MEFESKSINVDEPFLSQQAFRDFLKLPSEESVSKIGLRDLLEVAKVVIRHELNNCGCSEKELTGCRLEYQISKEENQEAGEIYSVQWSQIPQSEKTTENEEGTSEEPSNVVSDKSNPLSSEFMGKLTQRLDEMSPALDGATLIASRADFRTFRNFICRKVCEKDADGLYYRRHYCNGEDRGWIIMENGEKERCLSQPQTF